MGVTYATYTDVTKVAPIPIPVALQPRIEEYIIQASVRLRALVLALDTRLSTGALEADLVKGVVVDAVLRLAYNPVGAQSQTAGPFNMSKAGGVAADHIDFDPDVLSQLLDPPQDQVPNTFGVSVAYRPGQPQIKTLPGMEGMPFPGAVVGSGALDALRGYPYTSESVRALWALYGTPWGY